ncbi:hypothetical protein AB0H88_21220 [Nonomuraea sp. NPDC050680]|uniref:hypothetical protein n=1 Tax=Nonomuraea sp. NPDC050680 TaxID=3154630 RepID=UPI0033DC9DFB
MPKPRPRQTAGAIALTLAASGSAVVIQPLASAPAIAARVSATCVNTAADARTIQAAIDASKEGDEVVFKGPCLINRTITLRGRRTYRGDAKAGTVIKQADGANLPAMLASESWVTDQAYSSDPVRIERLTLDGNRDHNTGTVGLMLRSWDSRIYDVDILGTPSDGIRVSNPSKNGTRLRNTMVNSVISDVYIERAGGSGLKVVDPGNAVTDWTFQRSWIGFSGESGVDAENSAGWTFSDLHLYATPKNAIDAHRCFGTSIHNNYIEDFGTKATARQTYYGIRCDLQGEAGTTISNNLIHKFGPRPAVTQPANTRQYGKAPAPQQDPSFVYLALDSVNYGTGHATVTGNSILGHGTRRETGLLFRRGRGNGLSIASTGNLVDNVGIPRSIGSGVRVTGGY